MRFRTYRASVAGRDIWERNTSSVPAGTGALFEQSFAVPFDDGGQEFYFDTATFGTPTELYVTLDGTYRLIG